MILGAPASSCPASKRYDQERANENSTRNSSFQRRAILLLGDLRNANKHAFFRRVFVIATEPDPSRFMIAALPKDYKWQRAACIFDRHHQFPPLQTLGGRDKEGSCRAAGPSASTPQDNEPPPSHILLRYFAGALASLS